MLKILKTSARDTVIYSIGTFASKLAGFILVPLYTNKKFLSETDFGVLNLAEANLQVVISVFGLGLNWAYERWYWDQDKLDKRKSIFFSILIATSLLAVCLNIILLPFAPNLSSLVFDSSSYHYIFTLMMANAGLEIIAATPNALIRLSERPSLFTIANLSKLAVSLFLTYIFIVYMGLGLTGVYYAQIISIGVYFLILSGFILKRVELKMEWHELGQMLRFRFPFLLPIIALNLFSYNDRFVMAKIIGIEQAGIYSLGAKVANTIKVFLITAIWLALTPTIYKMMNDPQNKRFYSKLMTYLSFVVLLFVMFFSFFSKEIIDVFAKDDAYRDAYKVVPIVSIGILFGMMKDVSMIGLNITKKTGAIATITMIVTGANVMLNFLLVPVLGMIGAAMAGFIAQVIFFILIHKIAQRHYFIPYELRKIFLMIGVACVFYFVALLTDDLPLWLSVLLKFGILGAFPFALYLFRFYESIELERIRGFWNKWRNPSNWMSNLRSLY